MSQKAVTVDLNQESNNGRIWGKENCAIQHGSHKWEIDNRTITVLDHGHTHATMKWRKRWRTVPFNMVPTYGKLETWQSQFSIMGTDPCHNDVEKRQGKKNMVVVGKVVVVIARFKLEPQTNKNKLRFAYFQV